MSLAYTDHPFAFARRVTREVRVGGVGIGGDNPIRLQSMTTTDTLDTEGTIAQAIALADAGCEIVRITAPGKREAENLEAIARGLRERGVDVPLVADIHFTPGAALIAAEHVEKVRVNPGNYADKKRFEVREYSDAQYAEEIERVAERFRPLVRRMKELGRAMRIGTNHGSLSDRILNRYGDTPLGMVESALEFLDVCEAEDYRDVVFSMKASNPQVAIHAYRLLAARLAERSPGPSYPFHVGVTEAGDGEDGRIKSAIGIGSLLEDGIGETIRVSLTEDPVKEIPVARALAGRYDARGPSPLPPDPGAPFTDDPTAHRRRPTRVSAGLGGDEPVRVEADLGPVPLDPERAVAAALTELGGLGDLACEGLCVDVERSDELARVRALRDGFQKEGVSIPLSVRLPAAIAEEAAGLAERRVVRVDAKTDLLTLAIGADVEWCFEGPLPELPPRIAAALEAGRPAAVSVWSDEPVQAARLLVASLAAGGAGELPIVLRHRADAFCDPDEAIVRAGAELGAPLCDGIGDAVCVGGFGSLGRDVSLAYRVLQGARLRTSWTEFISCPSCGRTLFDLEETTARIKDRTAHLPGVKIAVMGCIVNGPGEMADADFGYVGSGKGLVSLYVGHDCVLRNVPESDAPDRLVDLIRDHGRWVDPEGVDPEEIDPE